MGQDITAVLLPQARIDFFALDEGTASAAAALAADWRFARVGIQVARSGIEAAVAHYGQNPSPEIIAIETNDISEAFTQQLGQLAAVCGAGTDAIVIGPTNDVHLYRDLIDMGVRDYLVRPVVLDELSKVVAKALIDKKGLAHSRLVSVIGSRGGVGATTMAQVLAWSVAEDFGQKTILMDAAGSAGTLGVAYGLEPAATLTEGLRIGLSGSEDDLKRLIQSVTEHLSLMVFGGDPVLGASADPDGVEALVDRVMQKHPVVIIDVSGAPPTVQKRMLTRSSRVVMVTTPVLSALRNCRTLLGEIKSARGSLNEVDFIVNMQGAAGTEDVPVKEIKKALGMEAMIAVPHAPKVFVGGESAGKPVGRNKAAGEFLQLLSPVAQKAAGGGAKKESGGEKAADSPLDFLKNIGKSKGK